MNIDALLDKMIQPVIFPQDTINEWIDQWQRLCNKPKDPAERSIFLAFFSPIFL